MKKRFEKWFIKMLVIAIREEKEIDKIIDNREDFRMGLVTREEAEAKYWRGK